MDMDKKNTAKKDTTEKRGEKRPFDIDSTARISVPPSIVNDGDDDEERPFDIESTARISVPPSIVNDGDDDEEAKKAKKAELARKKQRVKARQQQNDEMSKALVDPITITTTSTTTSTQDMILRKLDGIAETQQKIFGILGNMASCRQCVRSLYKNLKPTSAAAVGLQAPCTAHPPKANTPATTPVVTQESHTGSHIFKIHGSVLSTEERERTWTEIVKKINDKIRAIKNNKYKLKL